MVMFSEILALKGDVVSLAAIAALSVILGSDKHAIAPSEVQTLTQDRQKSPIIISSERIKYIASLRLHGFSGGVLVLSREPFATLLEKHRILRWSQGSHDACPYPCKLPELLQKVLALEPLLDTKLKLLQKELKTAPEKVLKNKVTPCLNRLTKQKSDLNQELDTLSAIVMEICDRTPAARHACVEIGGQVAQIQEHFRYWIERARIEQDCTKEQLDLLRQVFDRWCDIISQNGEALGV